MEEGLDTHLFLEIIQGDGARFLTRHVIDGLTTEFYTGPSGRRVEILVEDEFLPKEIIIIHLEQLGMHDLITRLYPSV